MRFMRDVTCLPNGTCLGVGHTPARQGAVIVLHASGATGAVRPVPGTLDLSSIACAPGGGCIAVGEAFDGSVTFPVVVEVTTSGVPGSVRPVSGATNLYKVACPAATTCLATGGLTTETIPGHPEVSARFVVITNGQPAPAQPFSPESERFMGISCPTSTRCLAVGQGNVAMLSKNRRGGWSPRVSKLTVPGGSGSPGEAISCPSTTTCHMTAFSSIPTAEGSMTVPAIMQVSADGVAGPVQPLSNRPGSLQDISCVAFGSCTVVGQDIPTSGGMTIEVAGGSTAVTFWANSNFFTGVSCVTAASCGIVGAVPQMAVFGWKGPVPS